MSGKSERFSLGQVSEEVDVEVPRKELTQRQVVTPPIVTPISTTPAAVQPEQGREEVLTQDEAIAQLAEQFRPVASKRPTSLRLPPWLDDLLNAKLYELKAKGYRKISREAIVVDALMKYFGIAAPPEGA